MQTTPPPSFRDLATLPAYRRRGIANALLEMAENSAFERSPLVRMGVGLHSGYGQAQRLYARRGWIPDGVGATYEGKVVEEGARVRLDDELVPSPGEATRAVRGVVVVRVRVSSNAC